MQPLPTNEQVAAAASNHTLSSSGFRPDLPTFDSLLRALKGSDAHIALVACQALGKLKHSDAIKPLLDILNHKDGDLGGWAGWALTQIGLEAVDPLITYVRASPPNTRGRIYAIRALGSIGDSRAIKVLEKACQDYHFTDFRRAAPLEALEKCKKAAAAKDQPQRRKLP